MHLSLLDKTAFQDRVFSLPLGCFYTPVVSSVVTLKPSTSLSVGHLLWSWWAPKARCSPFPTHLYRTEHSDAILFLQFPHMGWCRVTLFLLPLCRDLVVELLIVHGTNSHNTALHSFWTPQWSLSEFPKFGRPDGLWASLCHELWKQVMVVFSADSVLNQLFSVFCPSTIVGRVGSCTITKIFSQTQWKYMMKQSVGVHACLFLNVVCLCVFMYHLPNSRT